MRSVLVRYARHMARHARYTGRRSATRLGIKAKEASPLVDDFQQALEYSAREAQFLCRLDRCVTEHGTSFGPNGWNPFWQTAREIITDPAMEYVGSSLERFYMTFRPESAGEAVLGLSASARGLCELPPHGVFHVPWRGGSPWATIHTVESWFERDMSRQWRPDLSIERDGFTRHGGKSGARAH